MKADLKIRFVRCEVIYLAGLEYQVVCLAGIGCDSKQFSYTRLARAVPKPRISLLILGRVRVYTPKYGNLRFARKYYLHSKQVLHVI